MRLPKSLTVSFQHGLHIAWVLPLLPAPPCLSSFCTMFCTQSPHSIAEWKRWLQFRFSQEKLALDSETLIGISAGEMRQPNELYEVVWNEKQISFYWVQSQHQFQISCSPLNRLTTVKPLEVIRCHGVSLNVKSGYHQTWHTKVILNISLCFSFLVYLTISEFRESLNVKTKGDKFISFCLSRHKWKPIYIRARK